ncbi:MAG: septum formation initiator family protein [Candidatus Eisenbacteria bacterium]|uniref:Septum formation initiator family protein n=1 Tax=Eiseniibacteriota bacterium TaxID=2212470 RepID=A0A538TNV5_UNCEI|nr:MAG: septum formation initiator family protein [Candidatus Eisenbacteria bacterium]
MRDIGTRIQRYRLSRYGPADDSWRRRLRWAWPLIGLWLLYAGLLSEHSWFRLWRLSAENERLRADLETTRAQIGTLDGRLTDPRQRQRWGERTLRERDGMARKGEIIYRYQGGAADSAER